MAPRVSLLLCALLFASVAQANVAGGGHPADQVTTQAAQQALTPDQVVERLKEGNRRFRSGQMVKRDLPAQVKATAAGQSPYAVILSCLDSRIPVEAVFDQGIGDVFTARVAGNIVNAEILGSMEFATQVVGAKAIVVMGHTACGAVAGSCDKVDLGNVTSLVKAIQPSVKAVAGDTCTSKNARQVDEVAHHNVGRTIEEIRVRSPLLRDLEAAGKVKLVGAMYDISTGEVRFQ